MYSTAVLILIALPYIAAFNISGHSLDKQNLYPGDSLELKCATDTKWEYCTWRHVAGSADTRECHIEWKWVKGGTSLQKCHQELTGRVSITGSYQNNECGLRILDTVAQDSGRWECEVEDYVFIGSKGSGSRVKHQFDVTIREEVNQVERVQPATSATEKTTTTATSEAPAILVEHTTISEEDFKDVHSEREDILIESSTEHEVLGQYNDSDSQMNNNTIDASNDMTNSTDTTDFMEGGKVLPLAGPEEEGGVGVGLVVGIVVVCLVAVVAMVVVTLVVLRIKKQQQKLSFERIEEQVVAVENEEFTFQALKEAENEMI